MMHFTFPFVIVLVVFWASTGEATSGLDDDKPVKKISENFKVIDAEIKKRVKDIATAFENPDATGPNSYKSDNEIAESSALPAVETGCEKPIKDIATAFEKPYDGQASSSGTKTVIIDGVERTVQDLVETYELYSKRMDGSAMKDLLPTVDEVRTGLENGKALEIAEIICKLDTDSKPHSPTDSKLHSPTDSKPHSCTDSDPHTDTDIDPLSDTESDPHSETDGINPAPVPPRRPWWHILCCPWD